MAKHLWLGMLALLGAASMSTSAALVHEVALSGDEERMKSVLKEDPSAINDMDKDGNRALNLAAGKGMTAIVNLLLAKEADVNAHNTAGDTPLHLAVSGGHLAVVELLLDNKADIGARNRNGYTPLHVAAEKGLKAMAKLLVDKGADANARTKLGFKPVDLVHGRENDDLANFLESRTTVVSRPPVVTRGEPLQHLGRADRLVFEGLKTFTPDEIRSGLWMNYNFQMAAHPAAPRAEYLQEVQKRVRNGYLHAGFPEARVTAGFDQAASNVVVKVTEGPRYYCRDIVILGARTLDTNYLRQALLKPSTKALTNAQPPLAKDFEEWTQRLSRTQTNTQAQGGMIINSPADREAKEKLREKFANLLPQPSTGVHAWLQTNKMELTRWTPDDPAPFDAWTLMLLNHSVTNIAAELGHYVPKFSLEIRPQAGGDRADLTLVVQDEGLVGVTDQFEVTGQERNTREDILRYLELKPGMPVNRAWLESLNQRLWLSGRFIRHEVTAQTLPQPGKFKLRLELKELASAPPLSQELSPEVKALLRFREWLEGWQSRGDDLVITFRYSRTNRTETLGGEFIFSPRGLLAVYRRGSDPGLLPIRYAALLASQAAGLFSPARAAKLVWIDEHLKQWRGFIELAPNKDPQADQPFNFLMGGAFDSQEDDSATPALRLNLAPAVFMHGIDQKLKFSFTNGWLCIHDEDSARSNLWQVEIEADTGRLRRCVIGDKSARRYAEVELKTGAFLQAIQELSTGTAAFPNVFKAQTPISGGVGFMLADILEAQGLLLELAPLLDLQDALAKALVKRPWVSAFFDPAQAEKLRRATAVLEKVLSQSIYAPLERLAWLKSTFFVPPDPASDGFSPLQSGMANLAGIVMRLSQDVPPEDSWLQIVLREAAFVVSSRGLHTEEELKRLLQSDQTGPLGFLCTAQILANLDKSLARPFATRGLTKLATADFALDYRPFLTGHSILAELLQKLLRTLTTLDERDIEALALILPEPEVRFIRQSAIRLRAAPDQPVCDILAPVLDEYWNQALQTRARTALTKLAVE